jgi:hypothetical protein
MTLTTNARLAGATMITYLVAGIGSLVMAGQPIVGVFNLFESFSALVLAVTFYAITRETDRDIALIAMLCRVIEAVPGEGFIYAAVGTLLFSWLLLKGRTIPAGLAWLGVAASSLLVLQLVIQRAGLGIATSGGTNWASQATWIGALPLLVFEIALAAWFLTKGLSSEAGPPTPL